MSGLAATLLLTQFTRRHHQNNHGCATLVGNVTVLLFSEVRILGDATFILKPIANQHGEHGTVTECDVRARGQ